MVNSYNYQQLFEDGPSSSANTTTNIGGVMNYTEISNRLTPKANPNETKTVNKINPNISILNIDMGRGYHFTVTLDKLDRSNMKHNFYGNFLPVKSIRNTLISIESTSLGVGIFSDLPIIRRRKVGRISITLNDTTDHYYENKLYEWYNKCVSDQNGYVGYIIDMIGNFTYTEYDNQGGVVKRYRFEVMPDGDLITNRDYESNVIKTVDFNLIVVGIINS